MSSDIEDLLDRNDATGLADAVRSGDVSSRELVEASIARAEERNGALNAFVNTRFDEALAESDEVDRTAPFGGVPFVVKDLGQQVAGLPHTRGSRLFADDVSTEDSELVRRYRAAGFVVLGTTNTPELGKNASTEPLAHGPTRNPYDLSRSTGGSSGGTAAAITAGIVSIGHGNDGGGSIRIPASACGLFGLKPSRARTPSHPERMLLSYPLAVNHVLTRSVRDSAAVLDATAGPMPGDPYEIVQPTRPWLETMAEAPESLRIAMSLQLPDGTDVHPDCAAATRELAETLEAVGHRVVEASPEIPAEATMSVMATLMSVPMAVGIDDYLEQIGRELSDDDLEPFTRLMYDMAGSATSRQVIQSLQAVEDVSRAMGAFHTAHDLLLTPTLPQPSPSLGYLDTTSIEAMYERAGLFSALTAPFNISGQPGVSLPTGIGSDGMPIGVQLVAPFGREDLLLAVSAQIESAAPWSTDPVWPARKST